MNLKTAANCQTCITYEGRVIADVSYCDTETGELIIKGERVTVDPSKLSSRRVRREDVPVMLDTERL